MFIAIRFDRTVVPVHVHMGVEVVTLHAIHVFYLLWYVLNANECCCCHFHSHQNRIASTFQKGLRTTIFTQLYSLMIPLSNALFVARIFFWSILFWIGALHFQAANMQYTHLGSLSDMCETRAVFSYAYINCSDLIYVMIHAFLYISSFFFHTLLCVSSWQNNP